jgi:hypothetical protein
MRKLILCMAMLGVLSAGSAGFARNTGTTPDASGGPNANFELQAGAGSVGADGKDVATTSTGKKGHKGEKKAESIDTDKEQRPAPCCAITKIDLQSGLVTAQANGTGQVFQFRITDSRVLASLHAAQPIYANFSTHQVSVDGVTPCGNITSWGGSSSIGSPAAAANLSNRNAAKPLGPCCRITGVNLQTGIVTASENATGRTFSFKVTNSNLLHSLEAGQGVFANFGARQVSVDGVTSCCNITSIAASGAGGSAAVQSEQTQQKPSSSGTSQTDSKSKTQKPRDVGSDTFGMGSTSVQAAEPTTENAIRAATSGGAPTPTTPGSPPSTTSLVASPQLANFECLPNQLPSGTPIHCKVALNGKVPGGPKATTAVGSNNQPAEVQITTKPTAVAVPQTVVISPGGNNADFSIPTLPDAQGGWVAIYAAYQGATLSSAVKLIPSAIRDVKCFDGASALGPSIQGADTCSITPWSQRPYGVIVYPTQPPGQTITIPLSEPGRLHHESSSGSVVIPANQAFGGVWYPSYWSHTVYVCSISSRCDYFEPVPKTENHTVTIRDPSSGVKHSVNFQVLPASIRGVGFGDNVSAAQNPITVPSRPGQTLTTWVFFNAPPAPTDWNSQNAWLDVVYGGSSDTNRGNVVVQGPTNLGIKEQQCGFPSGDNPVDPATYCEWHIDRPDLNVFSFQVTVGACSKAENPNGCQATVTVSSNQALGRLVATINVTPQ